MRATQTWVLSGCDTTMGLPSSDVCRIPMCNGISAEHKVTVLPQCAYDRAVSIQVASNILNLIIRKFHSGLLFSIILNWVLTSCVGGRHNMPRPLQVDLLTLKVVSKSRVMWATSAPILVFLVFSVLDLGPKYATNRCQTRIIA